MDNILIHLKEKFKLDNYELKRKDLAFITVEQNVFEGILLYLKEFKSYDYLVMISAVDYIEKNIFQLTYILHNFEVKNDIGLRVMIDRDKAEMVNIDHLWAGAGVYQREIKELFGIDFPGCHRIEDPFVLEGWDNIPPMRRDFDTKKYSEETFFPREGRSTKDPKKTMETSMYPVETKIKYAVTKQIDKLASDKLKMGNKDE